MKTIATIRKSGHYTAVDVVSDGRRVGHWKVEGRGEAAIARSAAWLADKGWSVMGSFAADGVTVMELA